MSDKNWNGDGVLRPDEVGHQPEVAIRRNERQDPFGLKYKKYVRPKKEDSLHLEQKSFYLWGCDAFRLILQT